MNASSAPNHLYLNRDNRWLDFHWHGLALGPTGTLRLDFLPSLKGSLPPELPSSPVPKGQAGIVAGPDGSVYFSDTQSHRLLKIDGCDRKLTPVVCIGGEGEEPTQFREPRGVFYHSVRRALLVADSGNHRIQLFDSDNFQLLGIWGGWQSSETGLFDTPWSVTGDVWGNVYVVDCGNRRVQKFDLRGNVIAAFWDKLQKGRPDLKQPIAVAANSTQQETEIFILDAGTRTVIAVGRDGTYLRSIGENILQMPMAIVAAADALYVGDNALRRVLQFKLEGTFVGAAVGFEGPVASLALDARGGLLVHTGSAEGPLLLMVSEGFGANGFMWGGPFRNPSVRLEQWNWMRARVEPLPPGAHIQLFVYSADANNPPAADPQLSVAPWHEDSVDFSACMLADSGVGRKRLETWVRLPQDITECLIPGIASEYLWIGAEFDSEGRTSPTLSQIQLEFDHETYLQYLPTIYREDFRSRQFLARFLSLFESLFSEVETEISDLALLFDPMSVPGEFLSWLGGWLAVDLPEALEDRLKRQVVTDAFETFAQTGTSEGLRMAVHSAIGIDVRIEEPILNASWWSLPPDVTSRPVETLNSILGFTTMLVPAEVQGAVVGTTAVMDQSHLLSPEDFGVPLFSDVSGQFLVQVYRGQVNTPEQRDNLLAVIDRAKPAHTAYHLCVIEPQMRIGFQARVGIDTVLAGPGPSTSLGQLFVSGTDLILGGALPGRIGERSIVGKSARLGEASVEGSALSTANKHENR